MIKKRVLQLKNRKECIGDKGFSLIELIVTITIMVIFVAVVIISSSVIDTSRVKEVERGIDDFANMARSKSMSVSAKAWYMEVTTVDGEYVTRLCKVEDDDTVTIVDGEVYNSRVSVSFNSGSTTAVINDMSPLRVYFDPATGKVSKISVGTDDIKTTGGIGRVIIDSDTYDVTLKFFYNTGKIERE